MSLSQTTEPYAQMTLRTAIIALVAGLAAGILFVILPYGLVWFANAVTSQGVNAPNFTAVSGFNSSLTVLFPVVQGFGLGLAMGPKRYNLMWPVLLSAVLTVIELIGSYFLLREGVICLIILTPLIFGMMFVGALFGRIVARREWRRTLQVSVLPLVALGVFAEALGPKPDYASSVVDEVVVNAPPEYVWRYVVTYPENNSPPDYWLWQIGLPYPRQSIAQAEEVGAVRACNFSTGISFQERITELEPNRVMTFEVTRQPNHPEVIGHFQFDRGQVRLTPNADGTTTITATSWYRLFVRPAPYFDWWTTDITRQVHFRVLNHMKALAEADYAAAQAREAAHP